MHISEAVHRTSDNSIQAVVIDRSITDIKRIAEIIQSYYVEIELINGGTSIVDALKIIKEQEIDLLIIDDQFCNHPAFQLIEQQRFHKSYFQVIVTSDDNHSMEMALNIGASGYLMKPIDEGVFFHCIERVKKTLKANEKKVTLPKEESAPKMVIIPDGNGFNLINSDKIIYLKAEGSYVHIILENERYFVSKRLKDYSTLFDEKKFFRPHRSYLVNTNYIKHYAQDSGGYLIMSNGDHISISRDKKKDFFELFNYC